MAAAQLQRRIRGLGPALQRDKGPNEKGFTVNNNGRPGKAGAFLFDMPPPDPRPGDLVSNALDALKLAIARDIRAHLDSFEERVGLRIGAADISARSFEPIGEPSPHDIQIQFQI